jgi:hypothetical protein
LLQHRPRDGRGVERQHSHQAGRRGAAGGEALRQLDPDRLLHLDAELWEYGVERLGLI